MKNLLNNKRLFSTLLPRNPMMGFRHQVGWKSLDSNLKQILLPYYNTGNSFYFYVLYETNESSFTLNVYSDTISIADTPDLDSYIGKLGDYIDDIIYGWFIEEEEGVININREGNIIVCIKALNKPANKSIDNKIP